MADESKLVGGVGASANVTAKGRVGKQLEQAIQRAMEQAIIDATEKDGLRVNEDAAQIRERILAARDKAIAEFVATPAEAPQQEPPQPQQ